jgi:ADP-heptose:LPS heptosyltransferase/GT2 family glycosyltransferase
LVFAGDYPGNLMESLFSDYEEVRKSGLFDAEYYLVTYPDVAERNVDPLVHYLEEGARERRNPYADFDAGFYLEQCQRRGEQPNNPLLHYIRIGAARGFKTRRDAADRETPDPLRATDRLDRPPILVAIEALGVVGMPDGTSRLSVGGWALAAAPIDEITVSVDDEVVGTATYGLARPDVARLYPDRDAAARCGFILAVDLPSRMNGAIEPLLTVRTADGEIGENPLPVEVPPQAMDGTLSRMAEAGKPPMQLVVDEAAVDPSGILRIDGAVVCAVQLESVEAFIDGARIGKAEFGRVRPDIETLHPGYPNSRFSGFALVADVGGYGSGAKTIAIRATARGGITRVATAPVEIPELPASPPLVRDPGFQHHCDEITLATTGRIALRGWAVCPAPTEEILVLLDGTEIGRAELGLERPDLGNLFPSLAHARRPGFAFYAETGKAFAGEHLVTLQVRREDRQAHEAQIPVVAGGRSKSRAAGVAGDPDLRLHIDSPHLIGGAAEAPVRGNLEIGGWALAREGVAAIDIAIDGAPVARADYGLRRLDIQAAFPGWADALASGFQALLPHRIMPRGAHAVTVTLRDKAGGTTSSEFAIAVEEISDAPGPWALRRKMGQAEIDLNRRILERFGRHPLFAVTLSVNDDEASLRDARTTIDSLARQVYPNWRLLIVPRGPGSKSALIRDRLLAATPGLDDRAELARNLTPRILDGIASGAEVSEVFFTVLSPGDELGVDAFLEMAIAVAMHAEADFLYSDERRRNPATGAVEAFFKPQWSPDLMLSTNYVGRLWCARADLIQSVADPTEILLGHGEYDLVLRCTELAKAIRHVPAVLCERAAAAIDDPEQSTTALQRMLARRGITGIIHGGPVTGTYRLRRALTKPGLVSILIPTCASQGMIETCITTLRQVTACRNYEIICVENIAPKDQQWRAWLHRNADRVIATREAFNWAQFSNLAAAAATGEYLLFLNDDIEITDPDWLDVLLAEAQRPEIGVVGPRLLYPDRRVQHAGMFLADLGQGRHAFRYAAEDDPGYFGLALTQRNVIAVTGACLLTRRETFDALGGFNEAHGIINNDVDYCLRAWQSGLFNVYTPHTTLIHHEMISRAALDDEYDAAVFESRWRHVFVAGDPFFHPNLSKHHDDFSPDHEPTQLSVTGGPMLPREDIRRILVVKLDHIGDCIIAFPAVRRLKQHFPNARIAVLTARASQPVWAYEPSIEQTIEFEFFHPRSADGEVELTDEDWQELRRRLSAERFDLAVDLRKHPETRPVLQHTGARWLVGFDFRNQFPWLDVALEWTGDQLYARKRQYAGDDLVNLVDAIAASCAADRAVIAAPPARTKPAGAPVIWVHPTAGNDIKQWPLEYFAVVIDQLVEAYGARIVLTGAPGDEAVAAGIVRRLRHPDAVTSMIGTSPLAELPALMEGASLFLGNDSGLKHIAAGLGIPTVGVHGGTLDPREWGPVGPSAVAIARDMVCSPCYLSKVEDCHRGLACLQLLEPGRVYEACKRLLLLAAPPQPALRPADSKPPRAGRPTRAGDRAARQPAERVAQAGRR